MNEREELIVSLEKLNSGGSNPYDWASALIDNYDLIIAALRQQGEPVAWRNDPAVEEKAKEIFQSWNNQSGFVPWVDGGNSDKQDEARKLARAMIAAKP